MNLKKEAIKIRVLSLFDGISCGMVALDRAGIVVDQYNAFEIDKNAIKISKKNYPQIKQYGDVVNADFSEFVGKTDLLIGGSPCQNLCQLGDRKGLCGEESKLFFEYVRAKNEINPTYFLLENNASMSQENKDAISELVGVEPIFINSADFSAQQRKRLYWTNIPIDYNKYIKKSIYLKDILEPINNKLNYEITEKINYYQSRPKKNTVDVIIRCGIGTEWSKSKCLLTSNEFSKKNSNIIKYGGFDLFNESKPRYFVLTPLEFERLQTLPDYYTDGCSLSDSVRFKAIGNGWTVDVIAFILKNLVGD